MKILTYIRAWFHCRREQKYQNKHPKGVTVVGKIYFLGSWRMQHDGYYISVNESQKCSFTIGEYKDHPQFASYEQYLKSFGDDNPTYFFADKVH